MVDERKRFISEEDRELDRIRRSKLQGLKERKMEMSGEPVHLNDANFNETISKHSLALVDFWAGWCGPCRALAPTIEELADEYSGKVFVAKVDVDENPNTAACFQIFSIPTVLIMKNGKEVERIVGCVPKSNIAASIKKHAEAV